MRFLSHKYNPFFKSSLHEACLRGEVSKHPTPPNLWDETLEGRMTTYEKSGAVHMPGARTGH